MCQNFNSGLRRKKRMVFPDIEQFKGKALENVEPVGIFRCPNCAEIEQKNKELEEEVQKLRRLLELNRDEEGEI